MNGKSLTGNVKGILATGVISLSVWNAAPLLAAGTGTDRDTSTGGPDTVVSATKQKLGMPAQSAFSETSARKLRDAWLQGKIEVALALNRHLNPFAIDTAVDNAVVTLSGNVETDIDKALAGEIAKSIEGVDSVDNNLAVAPQRADAGGEGDDWRQQVSDMTTSAIVKTKLFANSGTRDLAIDVSTRGNVVVLDGVVTLDQERDLAEMIARNTEGVEEVENRLEIRRPHS